MKHIAKIQSEFLKAARKWDDLSLEEQKGYLKRHPRSKHKLTAKPGKKIKKTVDKTNKRRKKETDIETMSGVKSLHSKLSRLDKFAEKNYGNRTKIYWALKNVLKGKPGKYGSYGRTEERLDKLVKSLATTIKKMESKHYGAKDAALEYIKHNFVINRKIKEAPPKSKADIKKSKPKSSKVVKKKTKKKPEYMSIGHRIKFRGRRGDDIEGTITDIRSGTKYTKINVETDDGQHWWLKRRGSSYAGSGTEFIGETAKSDAQRLRKNRSDFESASRSVDEERKDEGRKKLDELNIQPGDKITIRGPSYNWTANVVEVDYRKGGVRIDQERTRKQRGSYFSGIPSNVTTHYRFIPARSIVNKV